MRKKVCLFGWADTSRHLAPYDDPGFEYWGTSDQYGHMKKIDRMFEIHDAAAIRNYKPRGGQPDHVAELNRIGCPVYVIEPMPDLEHATEYPLDAIIDQYGGYFVCSSAYMLALAIYEGFEEIHLYGIDMAVTSEYFFQRPCVEYWIGIARGKGIKVVLPDNCPLCRSWYLYGYDPPVSQHPITIRFRMDVKQIRAIQPFVVPQPGDAGPRRIEPGQLIDVTQAVSDELCRLGYAEPGRPTKASPAKNLIREG